MLDEVNVKRIARLAAFDINPVGAVEVRLNLYVGALSCHVLPARQQIAAGGRCYGVLNSLGRRRKRGEIGGLSTPGTVNIPLHGEGVLLAALPIGTEAHLPHPKVVEFVAVGVEFWSAKSTCAVNAIVEILPHTAAVTDAPRPLVHISAPKGEQGAVGVLCALRDDVDHTVDRVRSPDRAARSA